MSIVEREIAKRLEKHPGDAPWSCVECYHGRPCVERDILVAAQEAQRLQKVCDDANARAEKAEATLSEREKELARLRDALTEARDAWQQQLEYDIDFCCPHLEGDTPGL